MVRTCVRVQEDRAQISRSQDESPSARGRYAVTGEGPRRLGPRRVEALGARTSGSVTEAEISADLGRWGSIHECAPFARHLCGTELYIMTYDIQAIIQNPVTATGSRAPLDH